MKTVSTIRKTSFSIAFILFALTVVSCNKSLHAVNVDKDGIAIKGYDPVAYFDEGRPVKGTEKYSFEWNGAKWFFSSKEHLESFRENPEIYAPQYGGY
jgi:YHS domain-containing protein